MYRGDPVNGVRRSGWRRWSFGSCAQNSEDRKDRHNPRSEAKQKASARRRAQDGAIIEAIHARDDRRCSARA